MKQPTKAHAACADMLFRKLAKLASHFAGRPLCFAMALGAVVLWAGLGPVFRFSDTWQLVINTSTTIVTFLMVFLIQNTQNRDTQAMHVKLDELIRVTRGADRSLLDLEELGDDELDRIRDAYEALARAARSERDKRGRQGELVGVQAEAREGERSAAERGGLSAEGRDRDGRL